MGMDADAGIYLSSIKEIIDVGANTVGLVDVCASILWRTVKLPIVLPKLNGLSKPKLEEKVIELTKTFIEIAKRMGKDTIIMPKIERCELSFEEKSVDSVLLNVVTSEMYKDGKPIGDAIGIIIVPGYAPWIPIGIETTYRGDVEYEDTFSAVFQTALFLTKNPWVKDALKEALRKVFSNFLVSYDEILNAYNSVRT